MSRESVYVTNVALPNGEGGFAHFFTTDGEPYEPKAREVHQALVEKFPGALVTTTYWSCGGRPQSW